ncbi:MAG: sigma-70 family RNA polymerase sigma factor [Bacteroidetes bacterium]|nr:MAG: sigma-70 family RNA polymerase sigma factor [Bacteroidota bacterium]
MSKYETDEKTLSELKTGDHGVWKQFFDRHCEAFLLFLMKNAHMTKYEALEKYQDAVIILYRKVMNNELNPPLTSTLRTYLFGIGKKLAFAQKSGQTWNPEIPDVPVEPAAELSAEDQHLKTRVAGLLNQLDERCRQILTLIFLKNYSTDAVAHTLGLPSEGAVRKGQFDCLKKLRKLSGF